MREFAKSFYKSKAWQDCRAAYISYRSGLCERCLSRGLYRPGDTVHHKIHLTPDNINDPSVTLSFDNLMLLCRDCHAEIHSGRPTPRYRIDPLGRIAPPIEDLYKRAQKTGAAVRFLENSRACPGETQKFNE